MAPFNFQYQGTILQIETGTIPGQNQYLKNPQHDQNRCFDCIWGYPTVEDYPQLARMKVVDVWNRTTTVYNGSLGTMGTERETSR